MTLYDLADRQGRPFPEHVQESLSEAITRAISDPEADVDSLIRTAQGIGESSPDRNIVDLVRYATKALFNVSKRSKRIAMAKRRETIDSSEISEQLASSDHKAIEARILISEILDHLPAPERDVLLRFTYGMTHREIAADLGFSVLMSRQYLSRARKQVAELLGSRQ